MTHIAIQEQLDGKTVEWMEKVSDEQYGNFRSASGGVMRSTKEPSAAQKLFGDFDPKLAELTTRCYTPMSGTSRTLEARSQSHHGGRPDCSQSAGAAAISPSTGAQEWRNQG